MAVPTELLAGDVRDLRESNRLIATEISTLKTDLAAFRSSVETQLGLIRWVGVFFASILITVVASTVAIAWGASSVVSEVRQQGARLEQIERQLAIRLPK